MIKSGEKKEEYREIKPYWTKRLTKNLPMWETEWGAEPEKEYYVLEILEVLK